MSCFQVEVLIYSCTISAIKGMCCTCFFKELLSNVAELHQLCVDAISFSCPCHELFLFPVENGCLILTHTRAVEMVRSKFTPWAK